MKRQTLAKPRRRRRRQHPTRWRIEGWLLKLAIVIVQWLPERTVLALGEASGRMFSRMNFRYGQRSLVNIRVAYPDWSESRQRALVRDAMGELGRTAVEWGRLSKLSAEELDARVEFRNTEVYEKAFARGNGVIAVTAHIGSWEIIPLAARIRFPEREITAVAREAPNPYAQAVMAEQRGLHGGETLPQDARAVLRALRRNASIGLLIDQYLSRRRGGILVPFMGRRTWTNPAPATLALRTGAALIPVHCVRLTNGRYCVEFGPEFELRRTDDRRNDIRELMLRINVYMEDLIRSQPERWLWGHRRWHHSPDARDLYPPRVKKRR